MEYILKKSNRKGKRFVIRIDNKDYHFGAFPFDKGTFIDHKNEKIKRAWIARHKDDKNYNNKKSGIYYSRFLLWGDNTTLKKNIEDLQKKDNIKITTKL